VVVETTPAGRWLAEAVEPDHLEDLADGGLRIVFRTDALGWATRLLLMAGGQARAVAPVELTREAAEVARSALSRYTLRDD
jgi:predicted DNA-binding transcriptional regulator YafY